MAELGIDPISLGEWQAEMERRGKLDCKFVCPRCGKSASPADWRREGGDPQRAPQECIGRLRPEKMAAGEFVPGPLGGCDWAAFGLIDICTVHIDTGGKLTPVFAFAEPPNSGAGRSPSDTNPPDESP